MTRSQTPHDPADPFLTTREAALLLGVTLRSVQNYVERGDLHAGRTPGGHRRIRTSDVHTLAQKMGIKTAEPAANPLQTQLDDTRRQIAERDELIATLRARLFVPDIGAEPDWSAVDGAVAWHLIDRSGDGWGHIGAMMDAWRDAHPELTRLRAELADYKRRAEASASFLVEAEAVCGANAVDIRQLRAEVEQLKSTPPDQREDLHCAVSDLTRECNQLRAEVERLRLQLPLICADIEMLDMALDPDDWAGDECMTDITARALARLDAIGVRSEGGAA